MCPPCCICNAQDLQMIVFSAYALESTNESSGQEQIKVLLTKCTYNLLFVHIKLHEVEKIIRTE